MGRRGARREHANVAAPREDRDGTRVDLGGHDHFRELPTDDRLGRGGVDRPVERDDAAVSGRRIGAVGVRVGERRARGDRHAARVRVLDDHARGASNALTA